MNEIRPGAIVYPLSLPITRIWMGPLAWLSCNLMPGFLRTALSLPIVLTIPSA